MGKKKITYKDVDWELYRDNIKANISIFYKCKYYI